MEEPNPQELFIQHYTILESVLKSLSDNLGKRMDEVMIDPKIEDGKEYFPEGAVSFLVELHSNAHQAVLKSREVKHAIMACHNALSGLEKLKEEGKFGL